MTGSDILKEALRTAIQREADSTALYTHIAQNVKNPKARAKFERPAEMEQGHRDIVEDAHIIEDWLVKEPRKVTVTVPGVSLSNQKAIGASGRWISSRSPWICRIFPVKK